MKRNVIIIAILALSMVMIFSSQVSAAWGRGDKARKLDQGKRIELIVKKLDLTREQADKFTARAESAQKTIKADQAAIKEAGDRLKDELSKDQPDKNVIHDLINKIGQKMTEMRIARTDSLLELQKTLTPEQKTKFREMSKKKGGKIPLIWR
jgi:Spy/CpxP family protein refolding chaperone